MGSDQLRGGDDSDYLFGDTPFPIRCHLRYGGSADGAGRRMPQNNSLRQKERSMKSDYPLPLVDALQHTGAFALGAIGPAGQEQGLAGAGNDNQAVRQGVRRAVGAKPGGQATSSGQ